MDTVVQGSDEVSGTEHGFGSATETSGDTEPGQKRNASSRSGSLDKGDDILSGFPINDWTRPAKATKIDGVDSLRTAPATATSTVTSMNSIPMMRPSSVSSSFPTTTGGNVSSDSVFRHQQQQQQRNMLSFSPSSKSEGVPTAAASSYLPPHMVPAEAKNAGYYCGGGLNSSGNSSRGVYHLLGGIAGPFSPAQWLELEQQALIYKYITANQPIPHHLLIPIQKALQSAGFYGFNPLKPTTAWGWGAFHLGYSNSTDPEPGRCRRTDGKKWRCSRDAVPDQKYCERHMNRGRHRSRKHVEGLNVNSKNSSNGHSGISGTKIMSSSSMNLASRSAIPSAGVSFDSTKNFQSPSDPLVNRMLGNRVSNSGQGIRGSATQFSFLPQSINLNTTDNSFSITKAQYPYEESNSGGFGVVHSSGSIFSTTSNNSANSFTSNYCSSSHAFNQQADHLGLWPRIHTPDHQSSNLLWPGGLHSQPPDNTQLSMSLPMGPADFMSSTSSPIHEKSATLSPLRLSTSSQMGTATHMSLGVGLEHNDHQYHHRCDERQTANWIPISWEGGPLGEVLHSTSGGNTNTSSSVGEFKVASSSSLSLSSSHPNLLLPDTGPQQPPSWSPTGVLQRSALVSLSNSSAGSSPRADNSKVTDSGGFGLCNDLLGLTTIGRPSSLPAVD